MSNNNDIYIDSDNEDIEDKKDIESNKNIKKNNINILNDMPVTYNKKKMSDEEIKDYLKDSILIPKNDWNNLSIGSQISYIKNDGKFVKSGYIKDIYESKNNINIKYGTKLNTYYNDKYYKEFTITSANIKELYKKTDKSAIIEYKILNKNILNTINNMLDKITNIENDINNINNKIIKLEENHIKTIKFIKKLHNIKSIDDIKNI